MSGSGSAVFGVVKEKTEAEGVLAKIKENYTRSCLVETVDHGIEITN